MDRIIRIVVALICVMNVASAEAKTYAYSQAGSSLKFFNKASLHGIEGTAKTFSGTLDTAAMSGALTVQATAMTTALGPRDKKMQSFCLESSKFPTITFDVKSIEGGEALQAATGSGKVTLVGTLKIRDVAQSIRVATDYAFEGDALTLKGRYDFKWTDFNVPDPSIFISTLYPEMNVQFTLKAAP